MSAGVSNGSRQRRALAVIAVPAAVLAASLGSGCGSSSAGAAAGDAGGPAPAVTTVITTGGGTMGFSSGGSVTSPFGGMSSVIGGSSSGTADGGGDATTSGSSGGAGDGGSGDGEAPDGEADGGGAIACVDYVPPLCGTTPCDLRANTCCVSFDLTAECVPGTNVQCTDDAGNTNQVSVHCLQACECGGGKSCCGVLDELLGIVTSECQSVPHGGHCAPYPPTNTQASTQLCKTDAECTAGQSCVSQTCVYGAVLSMCGVQSEDPFDCAANDAGP